ncbi:unnamed protein product [Clonostachys chloroleuca]|uniref:Hemicentin-1-like von Willebrand factor A domain-containing protein n=1 Tax=Clonostachys chloroleuca TaxID=1926264 RepID=A0AA35Q4P1_9HYPO|nr:unnamed protein product [Clonostachys chloroleuca]
MSPSRHTFTAASTIRGGSQQDLESLADTLLDSSISQTRNDSKPPSESSGLRRDAIASSTGRAKYEIPVERKEDPSRASASSSTTSKTRERLREVELERDKLLRDVAYGKGVVERLKKEGAATELAASRTKARVEKLKTETHREGSKVSRSATDGFFKKASSTDLLFLMDTTSSMDAYMNEAKEQVRSIISEIREAFFGEAEVRISIVSYKDHGDEPNIQWLDFTPDADAARAFLENLYAEGGGDPLEDVLGGI